jgi:hypothetical protein
MKNWGDLLTEFDALLNDAARQSYSEALRQMAWQRACEYFAVTHTALAKSVVATGGSYLDGTLVQKPQDFLELPTGGVQTIKTSDQDHQEWLEPVGIVPGGAVPTTGYMLVADGIYLLGGEASVRLWYYAHYPAVVDATTTFNLPEWSEWAVVNLSIAYMLLPREMSQTNLRQFQDNSMRGTPEDNPPRKQATFLINIYHEMVDPIPKQERSILYTPGPRL